MVKYAYVNERMGETTMVERPTCEAVMRYGEESDELCGKAATHHIPESGDYEYRTSDKHLCDAHADEAASSGQKPVRRWTDQPNYR